MGYILRQSTATTIPVGPLVDDTDFKTRETAVVYNQAGVDFAIMKNNGTWDAVSITDTAGSNDWTAKGDGLYIVELTATQTNTVGPLVVSYYATGVLPWSDTFYVVEEAIYDALYASSATGALPVSSGGIAAAAFAAGAVDAAALAADAGTEIGTAVWAASGRTLSDSPGFKKNTELAAFPFKMVDATDHVTAETGLTVTATRSLDGAAFAACANAVAEIANGWYKITLAAGDLNADTVVLRFTATGAANTEYTIITEA